jgi:hypothetical protein
MDEQTFRSLLDADGILRDDARTGLDERLCFRVFSQERWPKVRSQKWSQFAERFCDAKLGITHDKHYGARIVTRDACRIVIAADDVRGTRLVVGREATEADGAAAEVAELRVKYTGLSTLARRCKTLWVVECDGAGEGADRAALVIAAVLAGTELGPILYPEDSELVGFKTASSRFRREAAPYR